MREVSLAVKTYVEELTKNSTDDPKDILEALASLNALIVELAKIAIDDDVTFGDKFQALTDMFYISTQMEEFLLSLDEEELRSIIDDYDPFDTLMGLLE